MKFDQSMMKSAERRPSRRDDGFPPSPPPRPAGRFAAFSGDPVFPAPPLYPLDEFLLWASEGVVSGPLAEFRLAHEVERSPDLKPERPGR